MSRDEFSIIQRFFGALGAPRKHTRLAVGDDAAVLEVPAGRQLVVSTDTVICGVHFLPDTSAADIAWKALAVNLSDMAAMAAQPAWFLLSINLPEQNDTWLREFSMALDQVAKRHHLELIGGDTCRGELSITMQIMGTVPTDKYVTRAGAKPGDMILVSGELGNAAQGLKYLQGRKAAPEALREQCIDALLRPQPRLELRPFLRDYASAAIDVSDGLQADLAHILNASNCGACLQADKLPVNSNIAAEEALEFALRGGDDYEICCCVDSHFEAEVELWNQQNPDCQLSRIGEVTPSGYSLESGGSLIDLSSLPGGYRHFD
ncbi:MAG: thiamine-phosphate kinase [Pseudomonadota bacterium]